MGILILMINCSQSFGEKNFIFKVFKSKNEEN